MYNTRRRCRGTVANDLYANEKNKRTFFLYSFREIFLVYYNNIPAAHIILLYRSLPRVTQHLLSVNIICIYIYFMYVYDCLRNTLFTLTPAQVTILRYTVHERSVGRTNKIYGGGVEISTRSFRRTFRHKRRWKSSSSIIIYRGRAPRGGPRYVIKLIFKNTKCQDFSVFY